MRRMIPLYFLISLATPANIWPITRQEIINAATAEAAALYKSAAARTLEIGFNVYHPNYLLGACDGHCIAHIYDEWIFFDTAPQQHSWYGAPFCYGGISTGGNCQTAITAGYGVGATKCNYDANGGITHTWASGIDCSHFVCSCLGISYNNTSSLPNQCTKINWDALQMGDLLIYPGQHVMIFSHWDNPERTNYTVVHASNEDAKPASGRVWIETGRSRHSDDINYIPYAPNCISGDPAASLAGFRVEGAGRTPMLIWETEYERSTRAFWVERAPTPNGPWVKITELIPARGINSAGMEYRIVDSAYAGGKSYYRLIEQETGWRVLVKGIVLFE